MKDNTKQGDPDKPPEITKAPAGGSPADGQHSRAWRRPRQPREKGAFSVMRVGGAHSGLISTQSLRAFLDGENTTSGKAATDGDK